MEFHAEGYACGTLHVLPYLFSIEVLALFVPEAEVGDKQPKDMQTNRLGVVDKHGRFMVTLCVTGKLMIKSI